MQEEWRRIPDFPNYEVSNHGRVMRISTQHILKPEVTEFSSLRVGLLRDGVLYHVRVNRLVAGVFFDQDLDGKRVEHVNGDWMDNNLFNLLVVDEY